MSVIEKLITNHSAVRRVWGALLGACILLCSFSVNAATLQDLSFSALPGNMMEVRLKFDGEPPEVKGYNIEKPARISLDLLGAKNGLKSKSHNLGSGNARSLRVAEAKDRTRVVIELIQLSGYSTRVEGQELVLLLGKDGENAEPAAAVASSDGVASSGAAALVDLNFRRGAQGDGQVVISLSGSNVPVDVRQEGGKIIARFVGADLPEKLRRRLDVTDFATPVQFMDVSVDSGDAVVVIEPTGNWEYLAYQADAEFTINVKEMTQAEVSKKRQQDFTYTGEKLSLNFQDIEVRSVLQLIADFTSLNLVASDTVAGKITLRLQNVPWDQALDLILKTKGLDKRKIGNVLLVAPADEIAAREQLELESQKKIEALAPLRSEYIRANYAKASDLEALIKKEGSLLSARGSISVDERTNTLIVQDTEKKLEEIKEVISILDVAVQQVLIEARIVVATTDLSDAFGIRWGGLGMDAKSMIGDGKTYGVSGRLQSIRDLHGTNIDGGGYIAGNLPNGQFDDVDFAPDQYTFEDLESPNDLVVDLGVDNPDATRIAVGFTSLASGLLELELSALESEGHGEVVSTPKVLTADQQPAVIASGTKIPYAKSTSSGATSIVFQNAELRLEVTPHITPDGAIIMELKVNKDSIGSIFAGVPSIDTNRVETTVLVNDGATVVLGGIFEHEQTTVKTKTPFLGDLPLIGRLFSRTANSEDKSELLIFITPRLVNDGLASN